MPSELMLTLEGHSGTVRCLDLNGNRLVSGSTDRTIKVCQHLLNIHFDRSCVRALSSFVSFFKRKSQCSIKKCHKIQIQITIQ